MHIHLTDTSNQVDGLSAAKSPLGPLHSQDLILLRNATHPPAHDFDDYTRASGLCSLAANEWGGMVDGFLRTEHGYEVVLCDFGDVEVVDVVRKEMPQMSVGPFFEAVAERYWGVGKGRVGVEWEMGGWVSAYGVEGVDLWWKGKG